MLLTRGCPRFCVGATVSDRPDPNNPAYPAPSRWPQDGVGRGDVKIKIRQCAIQQKVLPAIGQRGTMALDDDFFPLRAIDLLWLEGVKETLNNSLF